MSKPFRNIVGEAIGEASMCWSEPPNGVFDSTRASAIVDRIFDSFHLEAGMNVTRWVDLNKKYSTLLQAALELEKAVDGMGPEYCAHLCDQDDFDNPDEWCKFAKDAVESFRAVLKRLGET